MAEARAAKGLSCAPAVRVDVPPASPREAWLTGNGHPEDAVTVLDRPSEASRDGEAALLARDAVCAASAKRQAPSPPRGACRLRVTLRIPYTSPLVAHSAARAAMTHCRASRVARRHDQSEQLAQAGVGLAGGVPGGLHDAVHAARPRSLRHRLQRAERAGARGRASALRCST